MKNILVIGSSNADITAFTPKFPVNGETVAGRTMITSVGGKGANQATAAARAGGNVTFITKVGKDSMAEMIFKSFTDDNINTDYVYSTAEAGTGSAFIEVNENNLHSRRQRGNHPAGNFIRRRCIPYRRFSSYTA